MQRGRRCAPAVRLAAYAASSFRQYEFYRPAVFGKTNVEHLRHAQVHIVGVIDDLEYERHILGILVVFDAGDIERHILRPHGKCRVRLWLRDVDRAGEHRSVAERAFVLYDKHDLRRSRIYLRPVDVYRKSVRIACINSFGNGGCEIASKRLRFYGRCDKIIKPC